MDSFNFADLKNVYIPGIKIEFCVKFIENAHPFCTFWWILVFLYF